MEEGRKPEFPKPPPPPPTKKKHKKTGDELQKMPHTKSRKVKPQP